MIFSLPPNTVQRFLPRSDHPSPEVKDTHAQMRQPHCPDATITDLTMRNRWVQCSPVQDRTRTACCESLSGPAGRSYVRAVRACRASSRWRSTYGSSRRPCRAQATTQPHGHPAVKLSKLARRYHLCTGSSWPFLRTSSIGSRAGRPALAGLPRRAAHDGRVPAGARRQHQRHTQL